MTEVFVSKEDAIGSDLFDEDTDVYYTENDQKQFVKYKKTSDSSNESAEACQEPKYRHKSSKPGLGDKQPMLMIPDMSSNMKSLASPMSSVSSSSLILANSTSSSSSSPASNTKQHTPNQESVATQTHLAVTNSFRRKQQPTTASASHLKSSNLVKDYDLSKRKYLVGLNLFNRKPEKGIQYLVDENFLDMTPRSIAEFLFNRNCLSKQMIGDYISNTQDKFIRSILNEFVHLIDLRNMPVDEALRKFQSNFRLPVSSPVTLTFSLPSSLSLSQVCLFFKGEAQKIEHLTNAFSARYIECNKLECKNLFSCAEDTIDVLAYAIILLNTSIHNPNVKPNEKMKLEQFVKMTKGA